MKKIIVATLISTISLVSAMDKQITFPGPEEIKKNLKEAGASENVIKRLGYHTVFGDKTMTLTETAQHIESIHNALIAATPESSRAFITKHEQQMAPATIKALLKNSPEEAALILEHRETSK